LVIDVALHAVLGVLATILHSEGALVGPSQPPLSPGNRRESCPAPLLFGFVGCGGSFIEGSARLA